MHVDVPTGRILVQDEGPHTADPPLLLVHAFASSLRSWDPVMPALARERRVVRLDLLGHGGSDKPAGGYAMAAQAAAVVAVLDALGIDRVVAVGHSGGGDVVVALIEQHRARVAAAVLVGTPPNLSFVALPLTARAFSVPLLGALLWRTVTDGMVRDGLARTFAPGFRADDATYAVAVGDLRRMTHRSYVRARAAVEGYRTDRDLTDRIGGSGVPLLIVFGDEDQWVDPRAADAWRALPATDVEVLRGVGHSPLAEAPHATAALLLGHGR
jgi:pimeloyl-ACP methyl ester carboxylesterase